MRAGRCILRDQVAAPVFTDEQIARVAHAANSVFQRETGDGAPSPPWDDAPEWMRQSAVEGVAAARKGVTPEELHERWMESKARDGWMYGAVKDAAAKTHPCMVPYAELPEEQQVKDRVFCAIVRELS
jgi:hypothetical protein